MAQLERGTAYAKAPRPGQAARNIGRGVFDLATSPLGAIGLDYDPTYEGVNAGKWDKFSQISDSVGAAAGGMALSVATMGLGDKIGGVTGKVVGGALGDIGGDSQQPDLSGISTSKYGGKLYYKKGKRFMKWGGEIPPTGIPPKPNGDWASYDDLKEPLPPTPEEIARVMAEPQAQALIQAQGSPQKRMGGLVSKTIENPLNQWKDGGSLLTEYNGNTHELGGIAISENDEVEDKENSFNLKDGNKYIFSNSIFMDNKKKTFAQGAKRIASKYKLREGDAMAKTAQERELGQLSQKQEFIKSIMNPENNSMNEFIPQFKFGGKYNPAPWDKAIFVGDNGTYKYGGNIVPSTNDNYVPMQNSYDEGGYLNTMFKYGDKLVMPQNKSRGLGFTQPNYNIDISNTPNLGQFMPGQQVDLMQNAKINNPMILSTTSPNKDIPTGDYKPAYGIPMAGYAAQTLSNLPAMFAKPAKVNYDRINPEMVDLSLQRDEARRSRNLQYAMTQRNASQMDNAGQAGAYANAALSGITGAYGDAFNQSVMAQNTTNTGYRNTAKAQNAQIQMAEQNARQQEADAVRDMKLGAISSMGDIAAQAGKTYQQMGQESNMLDWLGRSNPDYTITYDTKGNPIISRKRSSKYGGKIRRTK